MSRSSSNYNMYFMDSGESKIILVLYVDDLFITGGDTKCITWLKGQLKNQFDMIDLGHVTYYLGVQFHKLSNSIFLSQQDYALELLTDLNMLDCCLEHVSLPPGLILLIDMDSALVDPYLYSQIVGKLIFLTTTRPDIAYATSTVSRYMSFPQQAHMNAVYHILRLSCTYTSCQDNIVLIGESA
jgi:hypothetical protein